MKPVTKKQERVHIPRALGPMVVFACVAFLIGAAGAVGSWLITVQNFPRGWSVDGYHTVTSAFPAGVRPDWVGMLLLITIVGFACTAVSRNLESHAALVIVFVCLWIIVGVFQYAAADFADRTETALYWVQLPLPAIGIGLVSLAVMRQVGVWYERWQSQADHQIDLARGASLRHRRPAKDLRHRESGPHLRQSDEVPSPSTIC